MSDHAFQTMYRDEFIAGFEATKSLLLGTVVTDTTLKGNSYVFQVVDSGGATAVTRGLNGLIPAYPNDRNQYTVSLTEWHAPFQETGFNIFASQGDGRAMMQRNSMTVINKKIDDQIFTALGTATNGSGDTPVAASNFWALRAKTRLGVAQVPFDGDIYALITPAAEAYMLQIKEFANSLYVDAKNIQDVKSWNDQTMNMYRWAGVNWLVHPRLPGVGTSSETCYMYHKNSIGHAAPGTLIDTEVGYNGEHQYSWSRATIFSGAALLQNSGVQVMLHDGSGFA